MKHQTQRKLIAALEAIETQFRMEQAAKGEKTVGDTSEAIKDAIAFLEMELEAPRGITMTTDKKPEQAIALSVTVAEGKYTVILPESGGLHALRYGEPWRDCVGDNLILALASELAEAREKLITVANAQQRFRDALKIKCTCETAPGCNHCDMIISARKELGVDI